MQPQQPQGSSSYTLPHNVYSVASSMKASLSNPYAIPQAYSSHYLQSLASAKTTQGYTISSTYDPHQHRPALIDHSRSQHQFKPKYSQHTPQIAHWHQPGNCRCTHNGCTFVGSAKSLEIHRMDRHLIYPPGWENRTKKAEWDADPSLRGYVPRYQRFSENGLTIK
jgi:hypothetical protein